MKKYFFILVCITSCSFWACSEEKPILEESVTLDDSGWFYEDSIRFDFDIQVTKVNYDLVLKMIHSVDYRNQNVYFNIKTIFPDGRETNDLTSFDLASNSGEWYGKCNSKKCKVQALLQSSFKFKEVGVHTFVISPHTRSNPLKGFSSLEMELWDSSLPK